MTLQEAIRARHSVRAYQDKPIPLATAALLKGRIDRLNSQYDLNMQYISPAEGIYDGIASKLNGWSGVPAYIAVVGKNRDDLEEVCGYAGELFVLYAQTIGLNTCWAGIFKRKNVTAHVAEDEKLVITIAVGYGENEGKSRKSKKVSDVTDAKDMPGWFRDGVEAALLAPTALNRQKFKFSLNDNKPSLKATASGSFVKIDLGIVKCHFELASGHTLE